MRTPRLLSILLLSIALVGCGNSNNTSNTSNKLRVGMECNYAPFNWTTTTAGEFTQQINETDYADGYDVVIATCIAEALGYEVEIVKTDWDNLIPALQHNEIDAIIAGMTDTETRRESVSFTTPYYISKEVIIVQAGSDVANITSIQELAGKRVIGQQGTLYDDLIDQIEGVIHEAPKADFPALVNDLKQGAVDAIVSELPVAIGVKAANPDLTFVEFSEDNGFQGSVEDASVSIAVAKDNTELRNAIQTALDKISEEERESIMADAVERQPAVSE